MTDYFVKIYNIPNVYDQSTVTVSLYYMTVIKTSRKNILQ